MERTTFLIALTIGVSAFALTWATVRHFTGLAEEFGSALAIAVGVGLVVSIGFLAVESRLFDIWRRRKHTQGRS